jgi:hypothetical protein
VSARLAPLLALVLASCSPRVTETLVTVNAEGIALGVDVKQLHLSAVDLAANFDNFDKTLTLCGQGVAPPCYPLPVSVDLYPGSRIGDAVRVLVEAKSDGAVVISDAAVVMFSRGVRERVDVVLYAQCLGRAVQCAASDQTCGADGQCHTVGSAPTTNDLATPPSSDMGPVSDLASHAGDVNDIVCGAHGLACCNGSTCNTPDLACFEGVCVGCGGMSERCCPTATPCGPGLGCNSSFECTSACGVSAGSPCCSGGVCPGVCHLGTCLTPGCGGSGQSCCGGTTCGDGLSCVNTMCVADACNSAGAQCCSTTSPAHCTSGFGCDYTAVQCYACGGFDEQQCSDGCLPGLGVYVPAGTCGCDVMGAPCCGGMGGFCVGSLHCVSGTCG